MSKSDKGIIGFMFLILILTLGITTYIQYEHNQLVQQEFVDLTERIYELELYVESLNEDNYDSELFMEHQHQVNTIFSQALKEVIVRVKKVRR